MKTVKIFAALLLSSSLLFTGCSGDYDQIGTTKETIIRGTWSIDYFYAGQDKTAGYSYYKLTFYPNGTVLSACPQDSFTGTWQMRKDSKRNDVLLLQLASQQADLKELNLNWTVQDMNTTTITMKEETTQTAQLRLRKV
jgi:hypothetical protein